MLVAAATFVAMDSMAKQLGQSYSPVQLVWARYGVHLIVMVVGLLALRRFDRSILISQAPLGQFFRGVLLLGATIFSYLAVRELPLAQVYVINFSSPVIVTLLAIPLLGEPVNGIRIAAVLAGFSGVFVAMQPDLVAMNPAMAFPVGMAFCFAMYQLATRYFSHQDSPITSLLYTAVAGGLLCSLVVPFSWTPIQVSDMLPFVAIGTLGAVGHLALILAMRFASASLVSPFLYSQLLWATLSGFLFFNELPTLNTLAGAFMVIGSGMILLFWGRQDRVKHGNGE
ncbi:hypothetical protein BJB45_21440 [Halomonas huangheensis]|uniref:EamA domain-containing protein n=2 Tax=Halomonas huangheensis TaxID=1178482 RepID=W1N130_9GAMM|nr:hypothetical protein BJB45_21440 [Halomonas huangheensis]